MKINQSKVSFQGRGEVIVKYHKFTEKLAPEIINEVKQKIAQSLEKTDPMKKEFLALKIMPEDLNLAYQKQAAQKLGLINEAGDIVGLPPKTIIIKNGDKEIADTFVAGKIVQKGGEINGQLVAKKVSVSGGSNRGVIAEKIYNQFGKFNPKITGESNVGALKTYGAVIGNTIRVKGSAELKNTKLSRKGKLIVTENTETFGKSKIVGWLRTQCLGTNGSTELMKGSIVIAKVLAMLNDKTTAAGKIITQRLETFEDTRFLKSSYTKAKENAHLNGRTKHAGILEAKKVRAVERVKLLRNSAIAASEEVSLQDSTKTSAKITSPKVISTNNVKFLKDSYVDVKNKISLFDSTKARNGIFNSKTFDISNDVKIKGKATTIDIEDTISTSGNSLLEGNINANFLKMSGKSKVVPTNIGIYEKIVMDGESELSGRVTTDKAGNTTHYIVKVKTPKLCARDKSVINEAIIYADEASMTDQAELHGTVHVKNFKSNKQVKLMPESRIEVSEDASFHGKTSLEGYIYGPIFDMESGVKLKKTATFDKAAYESLPLSRKFQLIYQDFTSAVNWFLSAWNGT